MALLRPWSRVSLCPTRSRRSIVVAILLIAAATVVSRDRGLDTQNDHLQRPDAAKSLAAESRHHNRRDALTKREQLLHARFRPEVVASHTRAPMFSEAEERPDHPGEAAAFRNLQLRDENGYIPANGLTRAKQHLDVMRAAREFQSAASPEAAAAGLSQTQWTWLGPNNIGGRIRSIVVDPLNASTWLAGSVAGGIWKTIDGGNSWTPLSDFMGNLAVTSMVIQPGNSSTIYAGTGEGFSNYDAVRGAGVFKSLDGGASWNQLPATATSDFYYVNRIAMSADGTVLLAGTTAGIFRSSDAGATFTNVNATGITDVVFHPTDSTRAIASGFNGDAWYSTNAGLNWTPASGLPGTGRVELAYARSNPSIVYAAVDLNNGSIYKSVDGGVTYSRLTNGAPAYTDGIGYLRSQGWYDNALWVDPTNANIVIVGGIDLWKSTDGGNTWLQISDWTLAPNTSAHADHHAIVSLPTFDGVNTKTVLFGNDGGMYATTDVYTVGTDAQHTQGWQNKNNGIGITQFYGAAGNAASGTIVGGTQDNGTLRYRKSQGTAFSSTFGGDGGFCAADPTNTNYFYGEYVYLMLHRSTDGGASSSYIYSGISDAGSGATANFIAPFILDPNNANTMLAGGSQLWRSSNIKAATPSWTSIKPAGTSLISAIAVATGNSNLCWVGHNNGDVYKSVNCAAASPGWTKVDDNAPALPNRYVTRITVDPYNTSRVYVAFGGYSSPNLWATQDGGASWASVGGSGSTALPPAPVRDLKVSSSNSSYLYAATEVGLLTSEDMGSTWQVPQSGPANVAIDELFWMGGSLVAATHGRGLFAQLPSASAACSSAIAPGIEVGGELSSSCNSQSRSGSYAQFYTFNATAGQTIQIAMSSFAFDGYMYLLGPTGTVVTENDDSGGNLNPLIGYTVPATGTYTVEATTYSSGATGPYTLLLTQTNGCGQITTAPIASGGTLRATAPQQPSSPAPVSDLPPVAASPSVAGAVPAGGTWRRTPRADGETWTYTFNIPASSATATTDSVTPVAGGGVSVQGKGPSISAAPTMGTMVVTNPVTFATGPDGLPAPVVAKAGVPSISPPSSALQRPVRPGLNAAPSGAAASTPGVQGGILPVDPTLPPAPAPNTLLQQRFLVPGDPVQPRQTSPGFVGGTPAAGHAIVARSDASTFAATLNARTTLETARQGMPGITAFDLSFAAAAPGQKVAAIHLMMKLTHPALNQLTIWLVAGDREVVLWDRSGNATDGGQDDDTADDANIFLDRLLSDQLAGLPLDGHWTLYVADAHEGGPGTLNAAWMVVRGEPITTGPISTAVASSVQPVVALSSGVAYMTSSRGSYIEPAVGEAVNFAVDFQLAGLTGDTSVTVQAFIDSVLFCQDSAIASTTAATTANCPATWTVTSGSHTLLWTINYGSGTVSASKTFTPGGLDVVATRALFRSASQDGGTEVLVPAVGQTVYPHLLWSIVGTSSTSIYVSYRAVIDGSTFCEFTDHGFLSGQAYCFGGWVATAGQHTLRWDLDYNDTITESNETNNSASKTVTPYQVDLAPSRAYLLSGATPGSGEVSGPSVGQSVYFAVDWTAIGSGDAISANYRALLDNVQFCAMSVAITPGVGGTTVCPSGWVATSGSHTLQWDLDYDNLVSESDETNNSVQATITSVGPDFYAYSSFVTDSTGTEITSPLVGQSVTPKLWFQVSGFVGSVSVNVREVLDGAVVCSGPVSVSNGGWVDSCPAFTVTAGSHTVQWDMDYTNSITETNEANNSASKSFTSYTDVVADRAYMRTAAGSGNEVEPAVGATVFFTADWHVNGTAVATTVTQRAVLDGTTFCQFSLAVTDPVTSPYWTSWCGAGWVVTSGAHTLQWDFNYDSSVAENVRTNNSASKSFTPQGFDLVAASSYWQMHSAPGSNDQPSSIVAGMVLYPGFAWQITGTGQSIAVERRALLDGVVWCTKSAFTVSSVPSGWFDSCTNGWTATAGTHTLQWDLDYDALDAESNETNNSASATFTTVATDAIAQRSYLRSAPAGGAEVTSPLVGQTVYLSIDWQYAGTGSSASVTERATLDGSLFCSCSSNATPGQSYTSSCNQGWQVTGGTHVLQWDLDYTSTIAELDETNNSAITSFAGAIAVPTTAVTTATATATTATLNGTINPNGGATTYWFEYDKSSSFSNRTATPVEPLTAGVSAVGVAAALTGLSPNTTYYFRDVATNAAGSATSSNATFTTAAVAPAVITSAATGVTTNSATVNGTVNANGSATTYWFEYSTNPSLSNAATTAAQSLPAGTTDVSVSVALNSLQQNTGYYFRLVANNSAGTSQGAILNFSTATLFYPLSVTKTGAGAGTVSSADAGINCGSTCSANYVSGTTVTLTAVPANLSVFSGWSGACSGTGTCTLTMNSALAATATFSPATADLSINSVSSNSPVSLAGPLVLTTNIGNAGPNNAPGVVVQYTLPTAGYTYVSTTYPGGCAQTSTTITCTAGTLIAGGAAAFQVRVTPDPNAVASGSASQTVTISELVRSSSILDDGSNGLPGTNNNASLMVTLQRSADLSAQVSAVTPIVAAGVQATYNVTVTNAGPDAISGSAAAIRVDFTLPSPLFTGITTTYSGATAVSCDTTSTAGHVICTYAAQAVNTSTTIRISGTFSTQVVTSTGSASAFASGSVSTAEAVDMQPANNVTSYSIVVVNTPTGSNITPFLSSNGQPVIVTYTSVTTAGVTTQAVSLTAPPGFVEPSPAYPNVDYSSSPATYFLVGTSSAAPVAFTSMKVCVLYTTLGLTFRKPARLRMFNAAGADITASLSGSAICGISNSALPQAFTVREPKNHAPTANAVVSAVTSGSLNQRYLDASGTSDPDVRQICNGSSPTSPLLCGDTLTYVWTGPAGMNPNGGTTITQVVPAASDGSLGAVSPVIGIFPNGDSYVTLSVTDEAGASASATYAVQIAAGPKAITTTAASIATTTATLTGVVNPNGFSTTWHFEYSDDPNLATFISTAAQVLPIGNTDTTVQADIAGLVPDTTYYFRLSATNANNTNPGNIVQFRTNVYRPEVVTGTYSAGANAAQVYATVDPKGVNTTYYFEYGYPNVVGTTQTPAQVLPGSAGKSNVAALIQNLGAETTLWYRIYAHNVAGDSRGQVRELTTLPAADVPLISVAPATLSFGTMWVRTVSARAFTIANTGTAPLHVISALTDVAGVSTDVSGCASVDVGHTCSVAVTLVPRSPGTVSGPISIYSDAPTSPATATIAASVLDDESLTILRVSRPTRSSTATPPPRLEIPVQFASRQEGSAVEFTCWIAGSQNGCEVLPGKAIIVNGSASAVATVDFSRVPNVIASAGMAGVTVSARLGDTERTASVMVEVPAIARGGIPLPTPEGSPSPATAVVAKDRPPIGSRAMKPARRYSAVASIAQEEPVLLTQSSETSAPAEPVTFTVSVPSSEANTDVDLMVNGKTFATGTCDDNGRVSFAISNLPMGKSGIKAVARRQGRAGESKSVSHVVTAVR